MRLPHDFGSLLPKITIRLTLCLYKFGLNVLQILTVESIEQIQSPLILVPLETACNKLCIKLIDPSGIAPLGVGPPRARLKLCLRIDPVGLFGHRRRLATQLELCRGGIGPDCKVPTGVLRYPCSLLGPSELSIRDLSS